MTTITQTEARRLALAAQHLLSPPPAGGREGVRRVIDQLGYVQIDTISVIERAHHHVLWTRLPDYAPDHLRALEEDERAIFEYWAHAASYLPMSDYRFTLVVKEQFRGGKKHWFPRNRRHMAYVLDRIRAEGPLMSRDFKVEIEKKTPSTGMDWARNPMNLALRQLFMEGHIMVTYRRGFQKVYDLPGRILPEGVDTRLPNREEYLRYLIDRDLRAHGLARVREIGHLITDTNADVRAILHDLVAAGDLVAVRVEGLGEEPYFVRREALGQLPAAPPAPELHILSPFDNLVIQRRRLEELFGFRYTLECYVPAAKRRFGYFALPLLWGTTFAGQIDLKADRKSGVLLINNLAWEDGVDTGPLGQPLGRKLEAFARFNGCTHAAPAGGLKIPALNEIIP